MEPIAKCIWPGGYAFRPFTVKLTDVQFPYSRHSVKSSGRGCNIVAIWTPNTQETLVNGVLQGRKQSDAKGASSLSITQMWKLFSKVQCMLPVCEPNETIMRNSYQDLKLSQDLKARRDVKHEVKEKALQGWGESSICARKGMSI